MIVRSLADAVAIYQGTHGQEDDLRLLLSIEAGVQNGGTIHVITEINADSIKKNNGIVPAMAQVTDGRHDFVLCTKANECMKQGLCTAEVKLGKMLELLISDKSMGGFCFDPWSKGDCVVTRDHRMQLVENGDIMTRNKRMT